MDEPDAGSQDTMRIIGDLEKEKEEHDQWKKLWKARHKELKKMPRKQRVEEFKKECLRRWM